MVPMRRAFMVLLASMALGAVDACAGPSAPKPATPTPAGGGESSIPIPADLLPHIKRSRELGTAIYFQDKASAIGTDALREKVPDFERRNLAGWLTIRAGDDEGRPLNAYKVMFLTDEQPPRLAFDIHVPIRGKPEVKEVSPPMKLDEPGVKLFTARQAALRAVPKGDRGLNPVIFPGAAVDRPESIVVYVLSGEQTPGEMVFGIHYRVLVSGDGKIVKEVLPLSKSHLVIPPPEQTLPPGATPVSAFVTHLVTDWPLETHVFVSLLHHKQPIMVGTRRGVWRVAGDQITLIKLSPATDPAQIPM
jgi:hypothetical protein